MFIKRRPASPSGPAARIVDITSLVKKHSAKLVTFLDAVLDAHVVKPFKLSPVSISFSDLVRPVGDVTAAQVLVIKTTHPENVRAVQSTFLPVVLDPRGSLFSPPDSPSPTFPSPMFADEDPTRGHPRRSSSGELQEIEDEEYATRPYNPYNLPPASLIAVEVGSRSQTHHSLRSCRTPRWYHVDDRCFEELFVREPHPATRRRRVPIKSRRSQRHPRTR